jgi:hypothetical protein
MFAPNIASAASVRKPEPVDLSADHDDFEPMAVDAAPPPDVKQEKSAAAPPPPAPGGHKRSASAGNRVSFGPNAAASNSQRAAAAGSIFGAGPPPTSAARSSIPGVSKPKKLAGEVRESSVDLRNPLHPIVLPLQAPLTSGAKPPPPEQALLNAFMDSDGDAFDTLMVVQLPSALPSVRAALPAAPPSDVPKPAAQHNSMALLPSGHIGKLYVLKSGKMKMKIGEIMFDVSAGTRSSFLQEGVVIDPVSKQMLFLGEIEHRIVVSPDIIDCLSRP